MKVLIIQFASAEDVILSTPVWRIIKTQLENVEVHLATKSEFCSLVAENPYLTKVHGREKNAWQLIKALKKERFELVINLGRSSFSKLLTMCLSGKHRQYRRHLWREWLMLLFKIDRLSNVHQVEKYVEVIEPLGLKMDNLGLDYFIPDKDLVEPDWLPVSHREGYIAVVISGDKYTQQLPKSRIIELCDRIAKPVVLLGGEKDQLLGEEIERFFEHGPAEDPFEYILQNDLGKRTVVFNACGKFNFNQHAALLKEAVVVFSHQTALMHVAAAFNKKIFSIWGSNVPEFGRYPYRTTFTIFENKKLPCRPCAVASTASCPKGHFKCMKDIYFDFYIPD